MDVRVGLWTKLSTRNWCFWTVVLEKTLVSPLDCKEIQPLHSEGDQPWVFFGRNNAKAETPVLWPPHVKSWLIGKDSDAGRDWRKEKKGMTEDEMAGWHHRLNGREFEWTPGVVNGQGGLQSCDSWGCQESDTTEWLNWTELCTTESLKKITYWHHQVLLEVGERERELRPLLNHNENQKIWGSENRSTCEAVGIIPPKRDLEAINMRNGDSWPSHPLCSQYFTLYIRVRKTLLGNQTGPSGSNERYQ